MEHSRGLYVPWYPTRYLLSRTRFSLTLPERSIYRDILDLLFEAGGEIEHDLAYLAGFTGGTQEQVERVLTVGAFTVDGGRVRHRVADEVIREVAELREAARRGGKRSAEVRAALRGSAQPGAGAGDPGDSPEPASEVPSKGVRSGFEAPPEDTSNKKEGRKEVIKEGSKGSGGGIIKAGVDNSAGGAGQEPGQVKTGAQRASGQELKGQSAGSGTLTPARLENLLATCRSQGPADRDRQRPWLGRTFGAWYARQRVSDQLVIEDAFIQRFGFGIDTGPQEPRSAQRRTTRPEEAAPAAPGQPRRAQGGLTHVAAGLISGGGR